VLSKFKDLGFGTERPVVGGGCGCRQEALTKIQVHKDRDEKEQVVFNQSMKVLERLMAHEKKMNEFMSIKCNDRAEFKLEEADRLERGVTNTDTF